MKNVTVKIVKHSSLSTLKKRMRALARCDVLIGVPAEKSRRKREAGEKSAINNAALAYIHGTGIPEKNIPARPFMGPGLMDARKEIARRMKRVGQMALDGADTQKALEGVGLIAQNAVRRRITTGPFEPLKPATLAARRRRGRTGEKPLIDTAQMRSSISFVVRREA